MNRNIVLGMIASISLATGILAAGTADAQHMRGPPPGPGPYGHYQPRGPMYHGPGRPYGPRWGYRYYDNGAAAALGILGGMAIGGAIAAGRDPYFEECRIVPRRVWVPGWGYRIRDVEICD